MFLELDLLDTLKLPLTDVIMPRLSRLVERGQVLPADALPSVKPMNVCMATTAL
jgi:hypothetical protein